MKEISLLIRWPTLFYSMKTKLTPLLFPFFPLKMGSFIAMYLWPVKMVNTTNVKENILCSLYTPTLFNTEMKVLCQKLLML